MVKTKKVDKMYKVPENNIFNTRVHKEFFSTPLGLRCTDNANIWNMRTEDAIKNSVGIEGKIIDEGIKDCIFFIILDDVHFSMSNGNLDKDVFVRVEWNDLISECNPIEAVVCE